MEPNKLRRIDVFQAMSVPDKLFTVLLALVGIVLFANGLYLVGTNGLILILGALVFLFITEIYRTTELRIITKLQEIQKSSVAQAVGETAHANEDLIRNIIDKKKKNPQQNLLTGLTSGPQSPEEKAQAKADHDFLVEMMRKKNEAMRTKETGPTVDPSVKEKIIEKQKAYITELMEPTIIPQRELAEKAAKKKEK